MSDEKVLPFSKKPEEPKKRISKPLPDEFKPKPLDKSLLFEKAGVEKAFKKMVNCIFKRADIQSELVPEVFPFDTVGSDKTYHFISLDAKRNIENIILSKRIIDIAVDVSGKDEESRFEYKQVSGILARYYFSDNNSLEVKIYEDETEKDKLFNYQFSRPDHLVKRFRDNNQSLDVAVNNIVQMIAVMIGLTTKDYALKYIYEDFKIRTRNSIKNVGNLNFYSRVNGVYICAAYPLFLDIPWKDLQKDWKDKFEEKEEGQDV